MNLYDRSTNEPVTLPTILRDFRGLEWQVARILVESGGGSSGKVEAFDPTGEPRSFYPSVFGCYIADEPRSDSDSEPPSRPPRAA